MYWRGVDVVGGFSSFTAVTGGRGRRGHHLPNTELFIILEKQLTVSDLRIAILYAAPGHIRLLLLPKATVKLANNKVMRNRDSTLCDYGIASDLSLCVLWLVLFSVQPLTP